MCELLNLSASFGAVLPQLNRTVNVIWIYRSTSVQPSQRSSLADMEYGGLCQGTEFMIYVFSLSLLSTVAKTPSLKHSSSRVLSLCKVKYLLWYFNVWMCSGMCWACTAQIFCSIIQWKKRTEKPGPAWALSQGMWFWVHSFTTADASRPA